MQNLAFKKQFGQYKVLIHRLKVDAPKPSIDPKFLRLALRLNLMGGNTG